MGKSDIEPRQLEDLLKARFENVSELSALAEGEDSRAFAFRAETGAFVARFNNSAAGFEKDRTAHRHFAGPDLPIPAIVLIDATGLGSYLCVSERLPGDTLQALPKGGAYAYGAAVCQLLDALKSVDEAKLAGLDSAAQQSWPDFVTAVSRWDWGIAGGYSVREFIEPVCRIGSDLPEHRSLVHGDFGSNNVLVANGAVTGLLDWSEAMIGDALYDVANILFWRPWLDCMEQQCRYFEVEAPARLVEQDTLFCYQLRIGLETLHAALREGDRRTAAWAHRRCETLLANA